MIRSFADIETQKIFDGSRSRRFGAQQTVMERKLRMVHRARVLGDLKEPPGNRLEKLSGNRSGQYSVRVNDQFRICFEWRDGDAHEVQIVDYR